VALLDRLKGSSPSPAAAPPAKHPASGNRAPSVSGRDALYQELKSRVHNRLFDVIDFARISTVSEEQVCADISIATVQILEEEKFLLTLEERERFVKEIQHEVFGLGPLEPLLQDPTISDILINGCDHIFIERHGKIEKTVARFRDDAHLMRIIDKIVSAVGRRIDESSPLVDARLADGSRVNVIIPPLALDGPAMSIRRFGTDPLTVDDLVEYGALTPEIVELLRAIVSCRLNVLISGGTGSGKTTLLNVVSSFIPEGERIVTIEDSAELQLKQEHVVRLETRPANIEGTGRIAQRDLVINSLRMRPDRIVVGEVRGAESLDMLQAMNTGHDGSMTTIHANSPRDALGRIENMIGMSGIELPLKVGRANIASAINLIVQVTRMTDGMRRMVSITEIVGMEGDVVTMQEIFKFNRQATDNKGRIIGRYGATGIRSSFTDRFRQWGYDLPASLFKPDL